MNPTVYVTVYVKIQSCIQDHCAVYVQKRLHAVEVLVACNLRISGCTHTYMCLHTHIHYRGRAPSTEDALTWFEVAAREGHGIALLELAGMYQDGVGACPRTQHLVTAAAAAAAACVSNASLRLDTFNIYMYIYIYIYIYYIYIYMYIYIYIYI
jgi:hypothetical protein